MASTGVVNRLGRVIQDELCQMGAPSSSSRQRDTSSTSQEAAAINDYGATASSASFQEDFEPIPSSSRGAGMASSSRHDNTYAGSQIKNVEHRQMLVRNSTVKHY